MEEVHEDGSAAAADEVPATEATEAGGDDGVRGAAEDGEGQPEGQQEEEGAEAEEAEGGGGGEKGSKVGNEHKPNPWKKRKMAMFLSYLGEGYQGMQSNPGAKTIEQDLQDAIFRAGGISEENHKDARKVSWSRAARTDKGVSALGQVVSLKMVVPEGIVSRINEHLPAQIRVLGYRRTTGGFEARKLCDRRRYEYILPAWAFQPNTCRGTAPSTLRDMDKMLRMQSGSGQVTDHANDPLPWLVAASRAAARGTPTATAAEPSPAADAGASSQAPARSDAAPGAKVPDLVPVPETVVGSEAKMAMEAQEFLGHLRGLIGGEAGSEPLTSERWSLLLHLLRLYEGTHNFHNFTVGQDATAASAKRHILSFTAQPLTLVGEPWIRLLVTGQSFMLHQIRKMVGMVLAVMRGDATQRELELALDPDRDFNVPMAPALGLFLAECIFKSYNDCWASPSKPFVHDRLALDAFQDQVDEFKAKVLYPNIVARDRKFLINAFWLYSLSDKTYNFSLWHTTPKVRDTGGRKRRGAGRGGRPPKRQRQEKKQQQHQTSSAVTDGQGVAEAASKATAGESQPDEHATGLSGS